MSFGRQYPIWVDINSCIYKQKKSYGVKRHSDQEVRIGTSSSNSHKFATVTLTHDELPDGGRVYTLEVDGITIKTARLDKGADEPDIKTLINS